MFGGSFDLLVLLKLFSVCWRSFQCNTSRKNNNEWRRKYHDLLRSLDIRLKIMVLNYYSGRKPDVDFVTFFVLNARQLESMTLMVQIDDEDFLAKQHHKLQLEKRASHGARFHFTAERRYEFGYKLSFWVVVLKILRVWSSEKLLYPTSKPYFMFLSNND